MESMVKKAIWNKSIYNFCKIGNITITLIYNNAAIRF